MIKFLHKETRKFFRTFLHPTFFYLLLVGNSILLIATVAMYALEKNVNPHMKSYFDSLWWGVSTITTVGFGDIVPVTKTGRIIGISLMYTGTVLFVTFTGMLVARWMTLEVERELTPLEHQVLKEIREQVRIEKILERMDQRMDQLEGKIDRLFRAGQ